MASLSTLLGIISSLLILFGQLGRIDIFQYNINLIDLLLPIIAIYSLRTKPDKNTLIFISISIFTFIINSLSFSSLKPFFYLIRLLSLSILLTNRPKINFQPYLNIILISNIIFGFIQYLFWPDFTNFASLNWDPHLYRLVSTYFDPTFTGLIYVFFLIYILCSNIKFRYFYSFLIYIAIALTYSRSTLLALFIALTFLFIKTKKYFKIFWFSIIIGLTILVLPRMPGEGTKLERISSIKAKIENYQQAFHLYFQHPIFGIGYNNISNYKNLSSPNSHAANGFDGSLMTILVTTGFFGLFFFVLILNNHYQKLDLTSQIMFIAFMIHGLFANSLLYPLTFVCYLGLIKNHK